MDDATLTALVAAIDASDLPTIGALIPEAHPEGSAGHILLASRACRRAREATADAIALACEGRLPEALETAAEAGRHLATMRKSLATAKELT